MYTIYIIQTLCIWILMRDMDSFKSPSEEIMYPYNIVYVNYY